MITSEGLFGYLLVDLGGSFSLTKIRRMFISNIFRIANSGVTTPFQFLGMLC